MFVLIGPTQRTVQSCVLGVCWCPEGYELLPGTKYCILHEAVTNPMDIITTTEVSPGKIFTILIFIWC